MPYQSKRECPHPGCRVLTLDGRCAKHRNNRASASDRGYGHAWKRLRDWYISQHPICEIRRKCDGDPAVEVDHIIAMTNGGERLDQRNLQSTCKPCHTWKTHTIDHPKEA